MIITYFLKCVVPEEILNFSVSDLQCTLVHITIKQNIHISFTWFLMSFASNIVKAGSHQGNSSHDVLYISVVFLNNLLYAVSISPNYRKFPCDSRAEVIENCHGDFCWGWGWGPCWNIQLFRCTVPYALLLQHKSGAFILITIHWTIFSIKTTIVLKRSLHRNCDIGLTTVVRGNGRTSNVRFACEKRPGFSFNHSEASVS